MPKNTKQGKIEELIVEQSKVVLSAVDHKFARLEVRLNRDHDAINKKFGSIDQRFDSIDQRFDSLDKRIDAFEERVNREFAEVRRSIQELIVTMNDFLKRLTDYESKFAVLQIRVDKISSVIKEKLGVEIAV